MGTGYAPTSPTPFATGETIEAADFTTEFGLVENAFKEDTGHTHDGTADEGGKVAKLLGTALTIGDGTAGTDIAVTFDGADNDGLLTWMEDEDMFKFSDDIMLVDDEKFYFGTGSDVSIEYDEDGEDRLRIEGAPVVISGGEGESGDLHIYADQGDDAGDEWKISVADGGVMTFGNDINSAGTYVTHMTLTPNATVTNSTVTFAGNVSFATALTPDTSGGADLGSASAEWGDVYIADDKKLQFGSDQDATIEYDEDGEDRLRIEGAPVVISGGEGEAGDLHLYADQGDDAGDEWKVSVADGGVMTFGNDINSAGTYVTHLTLTPNSTVASSTVHT